VQHYISYLFRPTILSYYSSKLSNFWGKLTFQIRQNYPAPVGFLPEPDFCRIWKKCRIPAGVEIRYSPNNNGTSCFVVQLSLDAVKLMNVKVAGFLERLHLVRKGEMFIEDKAMFIAG